MVMKFRKVTRWTPHEVETLTRMAQAGERWPDIVKATGRGLNACQTKWWEIRGRANGTLPGPKPRKVESKAQPQKPRCDSRDAEVMIARDALAARAQASLAPRSLTAWVFGDPPPGRSALDAKRAMGTPQP